MTCHTSAKIAQSNGVLPPLTDATRDWLIRLIDEDYPRFCQIANTVRSRLELNRKGSNDA